MKKSLIYALPIVGMLALMSDNSTSGNSTSNKPSLSDLEMAQSADRIIKSQLNYPDSYKRWRWQVQGDFVVVEFKAKNAFGMEKTETMRVKVK
mgnify:CR=1 FL=1